MRLHLIRKADEVLVGRPITPGGWIPHPEKRDGKLGSPAKAGWENKEYRLVEIQDAPRPAPGKRNVGPAERTFDATAGKVVETFTVEDEPAPPTDAEILEATTGLTVAQIKAVLGAR